MHNITVSYLCTFLEVHATAELHLKYWVDEVRKAALTQPAPAEVYVKFIGTYAEYNLIAAETVEMER